MKSWSPHQLTSEVVGKKLLTSRKRKRTWSTAIGVGMVAVLAVTHPSAHEEHAGNRIVLAQKDGQPWFSPMTPAEFRAAYPQLLGWIQKTLRDYESIAQPVASMHFARLPSYFDRSLLETVKFIPVDRLPLPPLTAMGLDRFAAFEQGNFDGITYLDRYFIKSSMITEEPLHFHELVHVTQWRLLGPERFLAAYANGLAEFGYENSPLEKMAYDAEDRFKRSSAIFDTVKLVRQQLGRP